MKKKDMMNRVEMFMGKYGNPLPANCHYMIDELLCMTYIVCAIQEHGSYECGVCSSFTPTSPNRIVIAEQMWKKIATPGGQFSMKKVEICYMFMLYYSKIENHAKWENWKNKGLNMMVRTKKFSMSSFLNEFESAPHFWMERTHIQSVVEMSNIV